MDSALKDLKGTGPFVSRESNAGRRRGDSHLELVGHEDPGIFCWVLVLFEPLEELGELGVGDFFAFDVGVELAIRGERVVLWLCWGVKGGQIATGRGRGCPSGGRRVGPLDESGSRGGGGGGDE